jgi:hypothetical protein
MRPRHRSSGGMGSRKDRSITDKLTKRQSDRASIVSYISNFYGLSDETASAVEPALCKQMKSQSPLGGRLAFCFAELSSALPALLLLNRVGLRCAPLSCFEYMGMIC